MQRAPLSVADTKPSLPYQAGGNGEWINQWLRGGEGPLCESIDAVDTSKSQTRVNYWRNMRRRDNRKVTLEKYLRIKHAKPTRLSWKALPPFAFDYRWGRGRKRAREKLTTCNARTQPLPHARKECSFIILPTLAGTREWKGILSFVSDMRGKCSRKAAAQRHFPDCEGEKSRRVRLFYFLPFPHPPSANSRSKHTTDWPEQAVQFCWILFHFSLK